MIIGFLLLFPICLIYFLICLPFDLFMYIRNKKRYIDTLDIIPRLGYIVGVGGNIGAGKSTSTAGITTFMEEYIMGLAYSKMDYIQTIINDYDFTMLNKKLDDFLFDEKMELMMELTYPLTEEAIYAKIKNFETKEIELFDRIYDDGIKEHSYEEFIREYIEAYMAIKRNNYVYSNIKFDSIVTDNRAFDLCGDDFKIKERLHEKNYRLRRYSIFFYDEATLDADKINLNWQKTGQEDSGTIEQLRLFRHYFKGLSYYYTTLQNPERLVKAERELFNSIIMIREKKDFQEFKRLKHMLNMFNWVNEKSHSFKLKTKNIFHIRHNPNKKNMYKNIKRFILKFTDKLNSLDYLVYDVEIYNTAKEAENGSRNSCNAKFVLPKKWCYSPIDTYEYSYQYDASVAKSEVSPAPKEDTYFIDDKIKLADRLLAKKVKKNKEKENKSDELEEKTKPVKVVFGN